MFESLKTVTCKIQGVTMSCERIFIYESMIKSPCNMQTANPYSSPTRQEGDATSSHKQDAQRCSGHWLSQVVLFYSELTPEERLASTESYH